MVSIPPGMTADGKRARRFFEDKKKAEKLAKKKVAKKTAAKSRGKVSRKKQPKMVKAALAALPTAEVTHYFPHVNAAVLKIKTGEIRIGDELSLAPGKTIVSRCVTNWRGSTKRA